MRVGTANTVLVEYNVTLTFCRFFYILCDCFSRVEVKVIEKYVNGDVFMMPY